MLSRAVTFLCFLLFAFPVPAQSVAARPVPVIEVPTGDDLPNIVVSGTRSAQTRNLTPLSIEIITGPRIEEIGATSVSDLLRHAGTTQVQDNYGDGSRTTIGLRGFGATAGSNTLVLVDGRRLNNTDLAPPDLNSIAIRDVERVEIIQGSSGVMFGDQAVGGVVNVITRTPQDAGSEILASLGSHGTRSLLGVINQPLSSTLDLRASAETRRSDGYRRRNKLDLRNLHGHLSYTSDPWDGFLEIQRVDEELQLPGALTRDQVQSDRRQAQFPGDYADTDTETARAGINVRLMAGFTLLAEWTQRKSDAHGALSGGTPFFQDRDSVSLNPRIVYESETALVTAGVDIEKTDYGLTSLFGGFAASTISDQEVSSGYVQFIYPLDSVVSVTVGARHARMKNQIKDTFSFSTGTLVKDEANAWEIGINYLPRDNLRLFLRNAQSYRFPKTDEVTFTGVNVLHLDTQRGNSSEAGIAWQGETMSMSATAYLLALEEEIGFDPLADIGFGFLGANNNLDDTERRGISVSHKWNPLERLSIQSRLDLIDSRFTDGPFKGRDIPFVSRQLATIGVTYRLLNGLSIFAGAQHTGSRYADGDFDNSARREGGFTVFNANLSYRREDWAISLRADNLTDRAYSEYVALRWDGVKTFYPFPERRYHLSLSYSF